MSAEAKVWRTGKQTWAVHARADDGRWIRVSGLESESRAVVEADALVWQLENERPRAARRVAPLPPPAVREER